eukprot:TRINITY_DN4525_c0_g1_i1.p2 TRINITY_DN4525_c0_g1~~TRINITY_DN4525_c0_g1_i1.p2  ORF type:complete len:309 (+),score=108.64 TRINITY_DN4525_c0_g1_i1:51-977(+)
MSGKLKFYGEKLNGYKKFYQIVSTIKRVALSKYQAGVARTKTRDYTLRYSKKAFDHVFIGKEESELITAHPTTYVVIGTNRGNCGPLNSANYRYLNGVVDEDGAKEWDVVTIGKKAHDSVPKLFPEHYKVSTINDDKQAKSLVWANFVMEHVDKDSETERIQIIFNRFMSAGLQMHKVFNVPSWEKFISAVAAASETEPAENSNYRLFNAILDMEEDDVKDFYDFHRSLVMLNAVSENELSEHAARILAVEGQLTNIATLRDEAQMLYNKTRQGAITTALIEILSAMTAMADSQKGSGILKNKFWETA